MKTNEQWREGEKEMCQTLTILLTVSIIHLRSKVRTHEKVGQTGSKV